MSKQKYANSYEYIKAKFQEDFQEMKQTGIEMARAKGFFALFSQPGFNVMRHQQGNSKYLTIPQAWKEIGHGQWIKPYYKGLFPSLAKEIPKGLYKGPLIKGAPDVVSFFLPDSLDPNLSPISYHLTRSLAAGALAGISDTLIAGPLDFCATRLTTAHGENANQQKLRDEFRSKKGLLKKTAYLYTGATLAMIKGTVSFGSLYALASPIDQMTMTFYGLPVGQGGTWYSKTTSAVLCGVSVACISSIPDIMKTQKQRSGAKEGLSLMNICDLMIKDVKENGAKVAFRGLPMRIAIATGGWMVNYFFLKPPVKNKEDRPREESDAPVPR